MTNNEKRKLEAEIRQFLNSPKQKAWDRRWKAWCSLIQVDDADHAWVPEFVAVFDGCYEGYDLDDITDVGQIREHYGRQFQWCRIYCTHDSRYEWRWIVCCDGCGSARCCTHKTVN
jgi:hypothetical protein